jgi:hypothetical protein
MVKATKMTKVSKQKKTKTEKNERRRSKRLEKQLNSLKPPRSPNRFILYRKYIQNRINTDPNNPANMRDLSKMVAQMWERETPEVKQYWDQVAERMKLNSSYRSSFDVINGLDMSISEISESDITFVNATASTSQFATSKKNRKGKSHTTSNTFNPISADNFIMESPELNIPQIPHGNPSIPSSPSSSSNSQWSLSPQTPQSPFSPQSPLSPQSPFFPQSPLSPQSPQSPLFPQFPLLSLDYQQSPQTPELPQSLQYQQYPQTQSPQPLPYLLQSPQLASDEDPSLVSSPSPSIDQIDQDFSYFNCGYQSEMTQIYNIGLELESLFDFPEISKFSEIPEPDYFLQ